MDICAKFEELISRRSHKGPKKRFFIDFLLFAVGLMHHFLLKLEQCK